MNEVTLPDSGRGLPGSQSTQIEQSRAVAEVQAAVVMAKRFPRDEIGCRAVMREACQMMHLAEAAFFRYSRGGSQITGPTIHLATELARCWRNIDFGVKELSRDDFKGESEMQAFAWDLETNTRVQVNFLVPHKRDKRGGAVPLTDMRDIYENNANQGARRLRECLFRVLPTAYIEEAKDICAATIREGGGVPLADRRQRLLEAFAPFDVSRGMIERKIAKPADRMNEFDVAALRVIFASIKRGETKVEDEFETDAGDELTKEIEAKGKAAPKAPNPNDPNDPGDQGPPGADTVNDPTDDASINPDHEMNDDDGADGDPNDAPEPWRKTYETAKQAFENADNAGSLGLLLPVYEGHFAAMPDDVVADLRAVYHSRLKALGGNGSGKK